MFLIRIPGYRLVWDLQSEEVSWFSERGVQHYIRQLEADRSEVDNDSTAA